MEGSITHTSVHGVTDTHREIWIGLESSDVGDSSPFVAHISNIPNVSWFYPRSRATEIHVFACLVTREFARNRKCKVDSWPRLEW